MKALIKNGTNLIQNFHTDDYFIGNREHPDQLIEVLSCPFDVTGNKTKHECGAFKYRLIEGVVVERDITETEEYKNWIKRKRRKAFKASTDSLMYDFLEKLANEDPSGIKWLEAKNKIRNEIK